MDQNPAPPWGGISVSGLLLTLLVSCLEPLEAKFSQLGAGWLNHRQRQQHFIFKMRERKKETVPLPKYRAIYVYFIYIEFIRAQFIK